MFSWTSPAAAVVVGGVAAAVAVVVGAVAVVVGVAVVRTFGPLLAGRFCSGTSVKLGEREELFLRFCLVGV